MGVLLSQGGDDGAFPEFDPGPSLSEMLAAAGDTMMLAQHDALADTRSFSEQMIDGFEASPQVKVAGVISTFYGAGASEINA
ncbi:MAG: hypothetical protein VCB25_11845 [Myxococcota bacterium]